MADDAGALLVRSGLVSPGSLDDARAQVTTLGGTLGEALVAAGSIADDELTEFYCSRLLVPKVNPNNLARLSEKVIGSIPADMAVELRAIPVALDNDNNLTVAMSDPSDRHAVDEIAFFTGSYVVRAVATQMQIAWCLAHYYGHVTPLGAKLLQPKAAATGEVAPAGEPSPSASGKIPRTRGLTSKVNASRHRAIAPITGPVVVQRPKSAVLDDPTPVVSPPEPAIVDSAIPRPRARSVSGEIRVPGRRAPSIRPMPEDDGKDDDADESGPVITMEVNSSELSGPVITMEVDEDTGPRPIVRRQKIVKEDPPELFARAGEVELRSAHRPTVEHDAEPSIMIDTGALTPPSPPELVEKTGEIDISGRSQFEQSAPTSTIEIADDAIPTDDSGDDDGTARIHARAIDRESQPILLDRRRPSDGLTQLGITAAPAGDDDGTDEIVVLATPKPARPPKRSEKRTQIGMAPVAAITRAHRDTETTGVPGEIDDAPTEARAMFDGDPTRLDATPAPERTESTDETLAPPPAPSHADTNPNVLAAPPRPRVAAVLVNNDDDDDDDNDDNDEDDEDDEDDDDEDEEDEEDDDDDHGINGSRGTATTVMTAVELDRVIPDRTVVPKHLERRRIDYDPVDDGWGPPGTTIPPPLLGAMPGSGDDGQGPGEIPMPDVDSAPLIVTPPAPPEPARGTPGIVRTDPSGQTLVRALEDATSQAIVLIRSLENAQARDEIIRLLIAHLASSHQRAGFFVVKNGELAVFAMTPKPPILPVASLRLDRPSTLQDVVGTRLPYRGPMHDDSSVMFLASVLGACPPEILLVPITIRERVVGVLFGEHRLRHTFDDQLALAARAAGMSLERILRTKR